MKKRILAILLMLTLLLSGCSEIKLKMDQIENYESSESMGERYAYEILDYLEAGDKEGLKSMFCEAVRDTDDFDEEIDELFEIWGDYTIEDRETLDLSIGGRNRAWDYGEWTRDILGVHVSNLNNGGVTEFTFNVILAYSEDESIIGMNCIRLWGNDELILLVGEAQY